MTNGKWEEPIKIEGKTIEETKEYKYLGRIISMEDGLNKEISERKKAAWRSFWALKHIYKSSTMPVKLKMKILETCTLPTLTYSSQTWALTNTQLNKLRVTQRAMERSILNIRKTDKIKNKNIRALTNIKDVGYIVKRAKFRYAGHMGRTKKDKWNKRIH